MKILTAIMVVLIGTPVMSETQHCTNDRAIVTKQLIFKYDEQQKSFGFTCLIASGNSFQQSGEKL